MNRREFIGTAGAMLATRAYARPFGILPTGSSGGWWAGPYNGRTPDYYVAAGLPAGSGTGTMANPWSIDKISNNSLTQGKVVGLMDGTYSLYTLLGLPQSGGFSGWNLIGILPNTAAQPTIIVSESLHGAVIDGQRQAIYTADPTLDWGEGLLGPSTSGIGGYGIGITIDGLKFQGGNYRFITNYGGANPPGRGGNGNNGCDNLTVQNCYFTDLSYITGQVQGKNSCAVYSEGSYHVYIQNCRFDTIDAPSDNNRTACLQFYAPTIDTIAEYITCIGTTDAGNLLYWKCGPSPGHQGAVCRYNYLDISAATDSPGPGAPVMADGSTSNTDTFELYGNVLVAGNGMACLWLDNSGAGATQVNALNIYNNTFAGNWSTKGLLYDTGGWTSLPASESFYNNIVAPSTGGGQFGDFDVPSISLISTVNYNLYPASVHFGVGTSVAYTTLASWQSATSGGGHAADANSAQGSPMFVATGSDAAYYTLAAGSPALTMAQDGGQIGAWRNDGVLPYQRGSSF